MANKRFPNDFSLLTELQNADVLMIGNSLLSYNASYATYATLISELSTDLGMTSKADKVNVLELNRTTAYTPTANYHPTTKKYVDDSLLGFSNVDNTSDLDKPISTATQAALDLLDGVIVYTDTTSGSFTPSLSGYNYFNIVVDGDITIENPIDESIGDKGEIILRQDGTGGYTITFDTNWVFPNGAPVVNTDPNAWNVFRYTTLATDTILVEFVADFV